MGADRAAVEERIETILRPLIQADGGDLELVEWDDERAIIRLLGEAAFGVGSDYVRDGVIRAGLADLLDDRDLVFEQTPNRPSSP